MRENNQMSADKCFLLYEKCKFNIQGGINTTLSEKSYSWKLKDSSGR